jgi:hypothetical protein
MADSIQLFCLICEMMFWTTSEDVASPPRSLVCTRSLLTVLSMALRMTLQESSRPKWARRSAPALSMAMGLAEFVPTSLEPVFLVAASKMAYLGP